MLDPIWFSPLNVMHHGNLLLKGLSNKEKKSKRFRKVVEASLTRAPAKLTF